MPFYTLEITAYLRGLNFNNTVFIPVKFCFKGSSFKKVSDKCQRSLSKAITGSDQAVTISIQCRS
jgi:hypothetical protein